MKVTTLPLYRELNLSALMESCKLEELHRRCAPFSHVTPRNGPTISLRTGCAYNNGIVFHESIHGR